MKAATIMEAMLVKMWIKAGLVVEVWLRTHINGCKAPLIYS
jgi:hypothetical protein